MTDEVQPSEQRKFALFAERKDRPGHLIQTNLPWDRLMEDIVLPFDSDEMFFIDGAAVKATDLDRLKILLQGNEFYADFAGLNWSLQHGDTPKRDILAKQYSVFVEAILRDRCDDVTSQVIKAYKTAIKPSIKDFLPKKEVLLQTAVQVFLEGIKHLPHK
jgi:hypothetical protein